VLGTTNRGRFAAKAGHGEKKSIPVEILDEAKRNFEALGLRAIICVGGDGSLSIAQQLFEHGVPVVGVPKTIDNDLEATVITSVSTQRWRAPPDALDRLHTTAASHNRVMVLEVMGRYAGWIATHAGIAGGATSSSSLRFRSPTMRSAARSRSARQWAGSLRWWSWPKVRGPKGAIFSRRAGRRRPTVRRDWAHRGGGHRRARQTHGQGDAIVVLGHLQRGGGPTCFDRLLCTRFGAFAVRLVKEGKYGYMVANRPPDTVAVKITEAIGRLRTVPPRAISCRPRECSA